MTENHNAREIALKILIEVERGAYADRALSVVLNEANLDQRDIKFVTEMINGLLRMRGRIDWILNLFAKGGIERLTPAARNVLRLGAYQILFLDKVPDAAAVNEAVVLAKRFGHQGTANLVNAVLRKVVGQEFSLPDLHSDPVLYVSIFYSHPEWMVFRWIEKYGVEETIELCRANNRIPDVVLRVNSLKVSLERAIASLAREGAGIRKSPYLSGYVRLLKGGGHGWNLSFEKGWFVAQDESAGLPTLLLDPQPGERILDLCSAPGGKATHMAQLMGDQGAIVAVDVNGERLRLVDENCIRLGIKSIQTVRADGTQFQAGPFERILVDAPCSGTGVLARRVDARWRKSEKQISDLAVLQKKLLDQAVQLLKKDGVLVYSTCSIEEEENERVLGAVRDRYSGLVVEDARRFVPQGFVSHEGCVRTFPHRHGIDGSFAVRLRKVN